MGRLKDKLTLVHYEVAFCLLKDLELLAIWYSFCFPHISVNLTNVVALQSSGLVGNLCTKDITSLVNITSIVYVKWLSTHWTN